MVFSFCMLLRRIKYAYITSFIAEWVTTQKFRKTLGESVAGVDRHVMSGPGCELESSAKKNKQKKKNPPLLYFQRSCGVAAEQTVDLGDKVQKGKKCSVWLCKVCRVKKFQLFTITDWIIPRPGWLSSTNLCLLCNYKLFINWWRKSLCQSWPRFRLLVGLRKWT